MKNLYQKEAVDEILARLDTLTPASAALWGKMNVAQAIAHCCISLQTVVGEHTPKRTLIGRLIGPFVKKLMLSEKPIGRNSPTDPTFIVADQRDLTTERDHLKGLIQRFHAAGPAGCSTWPHSFFGPMTPEEWAILMYKHLDHHLQQFGA